MGRFLALLLVLCALGPASEVRAAVAKAHLTGVRQLSSSNYTRVILDLTGGAKFTIRTLPASPKKGLPPRIYLDLFGTRLRTKRHRVEVGDRLVRRVRLGQFKADVVRVVLDLKEPGNHEAVLLATRTGSWWISSGSEALRSGRKGRFEDRSEGSCWIRDTEERIRARWA